MEIFKFFRKKPEKLHENYWFEVVEKLYEKSEEIPDPFQIRAEILIKALNIPSGFYSALEVLPSPSKEKERIDPKKDKIIAEYLINKPGVWIDKERGIFSLDFRDIYPQGLPKKLKKALSPETLAIMEAEYKHIKVIEKNFVGTNNLFEADCPIHYFRLPGGIDLFMKGYVHNKKWQEIHGDFLKEINKWAKVICLEGFPALPFGESLNIHWNKKIGPYEVLMGHYDILMHQAVEAGFKGLFTEIDARDISRIRMDNVPSQIPTSNFPFEIPFLIFPDLPDDFFVKYFEYLQREHPSLVKIIESPQKLKEFLITQSSTFETKGLIRRMKNFFYKGKGYIYHPYVTETGETSLEPTFLELGQKLFSDALAAIKLHLIGKLMVDGYIEKGPIIDYEGLSHLSSKSFFLQYPQYAMEVVLRTINELMAGRVEKLEGIYKVFENPDWSEIIKEITRLVFKKVEGNELKNVEIDFLKTYNLDPQKIMPSDKEIQEIIKKLEKAKELRKE
jgi:hypothetical protein